MAEAGYPKGFDVVFSMQGSATYMNPAEVMQDQLRQIDINVTFDKMERALTLTSSLASVSSSPACA